MSQNGSRVKNILPSMQGVRESQSWSILTRDKGTGFFFQGELMFIGFLLERVKDRLATDK